MKSDILCDELEVWGFDKNFIIFDDASLGFGLRLNPIDVSFQSDEEKNGIAASVMQFLNGLSSNMDIQIVCDITGGNEKDISEFQTLSQKSTNVTAKALANQRAEMYRGFDQAGIIPKYNFYLFVRRPMTTKLTDKPKFKIKFERYPAIAESRFESEIEQIERLKSDFIQNLKYLSITAKPMSSNEVITLMYNQWNPERRVPFQSYNPENIKSSVTFSDVLISSTGFSMGATKHKILSLKLWPEITYSCLGAALQSLPFGTRLFFTVHSPDQTKEIQSLQNQRRMAFSLARGRNSGAHDIESEAKLQDLEDLLGQLVASGEKVFHVSLNILIRAQTENELEDKLNSALLAVRGLSGSEAMVESIATFSIFSQMAIPNARAKERSKRIKTSNLADIFPIYGPWTGTQKSSLLFRSNQGALLRFDPFDSEFSNSNQLISGGSGSGKSYLCNLILMQMLKENPKVFFVDIGGSYKKLCENLDGQYIPLGVDASISLNPFDLVEGQNEVTPEKIKFLLGLIELMTKEDGENRLPKLERAEIEKAIGEVYKKHTTPRLSNLRDLLLESTDPTIQKYGKILTPWCGDSLFGRFLDRKTSIELNKPVVAFDLKGLESYPELQAVCLFIITDLVWREVQKDRTTKKFLVFDECWKLLKNESGIVFIEEVFRTFRKYMASAIAISQDMDDFAKSKISSALLSNCSIKWLLMQQQVDEEKLKTILGLNENEIETIKSLHQEKGRYSQAFLIAQKNRSVIQIESTPLEYWIATTDPKDLGEVEKLQKEKSDLSNFEVLTILAEKFPTGVSSFEKERHL
ncbi:MAG: hypothetical protein A4S09_03350 [Proteobacteria bacterium SG_bin7]|nr:MAG: hypothetical protein A4S09_03350 [Proteobacteria bacterium SG_bin7]